MGDDELFGGPGGDELLGNAGSNLLSGGKGGDEIAADFLINDGTDDVKGNDIVNATEGTKDVIDCGDGLDKVKNCEVKDPL